MQNYRVIISAEIEVKAESKQEAENKVRTEMMDIGEFNVERLVNKLNFDAIIENIKL